VNAVVPRQALFRQTFHRADDGFVLHRDLVLDNGVKGRMNREVGQLDPRRAVEGLDQTDSKLLIERKPLLRIGRLVGVVCVHGQGVPAEAEISGALWRDRRNDE
jgi:hypothetical protein